MYIIFAKIYYTRLLKSHTHTQNNREKKITQIESSENVFQYLPHHYSDSKLRGTLI